LLEVARAGVFAVLFAAFHICFAAWGEPPSVSKRTPLPDQGTISPSGKFSPSPAMTTNDLPPRTTADAQTTLQQALRVSQTGSNTFQIGRVEFDKQNRTVTVPARVCLRTQIVEYALVTQTGKAYESVFTTEASPVDLHLAFLLLGLAPVPVGGDPRMPAPVPDTNALKIEVTWETNGQPVRYPLSELISLAEKGPESPGRNLTVEKWLYNGSVFDRWGFAAPREGSIVALIRDPAALINNPGGDRDNDNLHMPNARLLPAEGWSVHFVMSLPQRPLPPPTKPPPWASPVTPLSTNQSANGQR
jgi:hypothetical protein